MHDFYVELVPWVMRAAVELDKDYGVDRVLEAGCGTGVFGAVLRQLLDYNDGRVERPLWEKRIIGLEPDGGARSPNWQHYDAVHDSDVMEYFSGGEPDFDLVVCADLPGRSAREESVRLLKALQGAAGKALLVSAAWDTRRRDARTPGQEGEVADRCVGIEPELLEALFPRTRIEDLGTRWAALVKNEFLPL